MPEKVGIHRLTFETLEQGGGELVPNGKKKTRILNVKKQKGFLYVSDMPSAFVCKRVLFTNTELAYILVLLRAEPIRAVMQTNAVGCPTVDPETNPAEEGPLERRVVGFRNNAASERLSGLGLGFK